MGRRLGRRLVEALGASPRTAASASVPRAQAQPRAHVGAARSNSSKGEVEAVHRSVHPPAVGGAATLAAISKALPTTIVTEMILSLSLHRPHGIRISSGMASAAATSSTDLAPAALARGGSSSLSTCLSLRWHLRTFWRWESYRTRAASGSNTSTPPRPQAPPRGLQLFLSETF